ncbi:hypothetical protein H0H87_012116 [Tephrocybe sp. NHM501043]|nr:hypothetical protein H0H87_012116 [Tephrocybe sp. NHM501043]
MRGLAFPSSAVFNRETSYDYGTPTPHPDDIPIDPALAEPVIDPALMEEGIDVTNQNKPPQSQLPLQSLPPPRQPAQQYSDGPQGDPYAPVPLPILYPIEDRILFCDSCDRGWHMDCLDPPMQDAPTGRWHCSMCPPPTFVPVDSAIEDGPTTPGVREASIASSSRSHLKNPKKNKVKSRGRPKAAALMGYPSDAEVEVDIDTTPVASKLRARSKKNKATPSKPQYFEDGLIPATSPRQKRTRAHSPVSHPLPRIHLRLSQKGKERDCEEEDPGKGLFDNILTEEERETSKTSITLADKIRFDQSRAIAEAQNVPPPPPPVSQASDALDFPSTPGPSSRPLRSSVFHASIAPSSTPLLHSASPAPSSATPAPVSNEPPLLRIRSIRFGQYEIKTWYDAPFPEESKQLKCKSRHPPGDEIYRDGAVSVFEVDGRKNKVLDMIFRHKF